MSAKPTPDIELTGPRRDALLALAHADRQRINCWRSNHSELDSTPVRVHHRTADWLEAEGLAELTGDLLRITPAGRVQAGKAATLRALGEA